MSASLISKSPKTHICFLYATVCKISGSLAKMSPTPPADSIPKPSPLTNLKLLAVFKKVRGNKIRIEDVNALGDKYLKKETSIRYVSSY